VTVIVKLDATRDTNDIDLYKNKSPAVAREGRPY